MARSQAMVDGETHGTAMDVFAVRDTVIAEYAAYIGSFLRIRDRDIERYVKEELDGGRLWPDPLVGLNPSFEPGETVDELVARGMLHEGCRRIFRRDKDARGVGEPLRFHRHQQQAIEAARRGGSYVLTTGTGSGKSLAYFVPIIDHVLRHGGRHGIKAIVVYPMNALCNSQMEELTKFLKVGFPEGGEPVRFNRYTGQESQEERAAIAAAPPDILLTNFMMLELLLTRTDADDRQIVRAAQGLEFLVLDELHTYRGRQGADVAMLVRRVRDRCGAPGMRCIGTSATLAGSGTREDRAVAVAEV
ncbi:MAG TPA: DEAD/DEAH box helicase, partial [Chloroflexota bacterium]|nr:DEAD/DEAH box helicase [Chloroflexota bacterium]